VQTLINTWFALFLFFCYSFRIVNEIKICYCFVIKKTWGFQDVFSP